MYSYKHRDHISLNDGETGCIDKTPQILNERYKLQMNTNGRIQSQLWQPELGMLGLCLSYRDSHEPRSKPFVGDQTTK